ncbi:phosphate ABC transporter permease subunit PstC [Halopenitus sp. H-Gu1]|uniref:phosphate ABC transporter permease subunit PstC n=1 Tax=Halopenitus sp. H-Gu1 TaxID=3242697 RepID=UPI00359F0EC6
MPHSRDSPIRRDGLAVRKERLYRRLLAGSALLTFLVTVGIVLALIGQTLRFFGAISPIDYLTGTDWSPLIGDPTYGVLPLVSGTLLITFVSAAIALPIGLAIAIYLSEYASNRARSVFKPTLELLAGVPTVIYGYFALVYLTPILDRPLPLSIPIIPTWTPVLPEYTLVVPSLRTFNVLSASIVVGLMIIPMVSSISEDALSAVPDSLRNAAYGVGSTKLDVSTRVVVPAATSGIVSSYVLALSRAIGETMAVTIAAGQSPRMPYFPNVLDNLAQSTETITAAMVNIAQAESRSGVAFESMFALGMTLFVITLIMNVLAEWIRRRYREEYA